MLLAIHETLLRLRLTSRRFFSMAHFHTFGKDVDCSADALIFETRGTVPAYVAKYMSHLQGELI